MRLWLPIILLLCAVVACSLTGGQDPTPTRILPTPVVIITTPTPTAGVTNTPPAAATTAPTNRPTTPCTPRTNWPIYTVVAGDTLFGIAVRVGTTVDDLVAANCLTNADTISAGQRLYVPAVPPPAPTNTSRPTQNPSCPNRWFFTFEEGEEDTLPTCPGPVITVPAVGQDFEGGRAYRYGPMPGSTDQRGTVYIIYNDGYWETYPDVWDASQPELDPTIFPPPGRYQPVRSIGKVWRDNPSVRQRLGWAFELESTFTGRFQEPQDIPGLWNNRTHYFYIDHGKWGIVLRLYAVDMGPNTWEVAGGY